MVLGFQVWILDLRFWVWALGSEEFSTDPFALWGSCYGKVLCSPGPTTRAEHAKHFMPTSGNQI